MHRPSIQLGTAACAAVAMFLAPTAGAALASGATPPPAPAVTPTPDAARGARLVQTHGCQACHGASFQGGLGPKLSGIEHRLGLEEIAERILHPTAPMPNFGFTRSQALDIAAFLSGLDGGSGTVPTVTFRPGPGTLEGTVVVRFSGAPPARVSAVAIMHMTGMTMPPIALHLRPDPADPHRLTATVHFSMAGAWIIRITAGTAVRELPVTIGS
jgi:mono/diheme cytochrome c family protein